MLIAEFFLALLAWLNQQQHFSLFFAKYQRLVKFLFLGAVLGSLASNKTLRNAFGSFHLVEITDSGLAICQENKTSEGNQFCFLLHQKLDPRDVIRILDEFSERNFRKENLKLELVKYCKKKIDENVAILNNMMFCEIEITPLPQNNLTDNINKYAGVELNERIFGSSQRKTRIFSNRNFLEEEIDDVRQIFQNLTASFEFVLSSPELMTVVCGCLLVLKKSTFTVHIGTSSNGNPNTLFLTPVGLKSSKISQYVSINFETSYEQFGDLERQNCSAMTKNNIHLTQLFPHAKQGEKKTKVHVTKSLSWAILKFLTNEHKLGDVFYVKLHEMIRQAFSLNQMKSIEWFSRGYFLQQDEDSDKIHINFIQTKEKNLLHFSLADQNITQKCIFVELEPWKTNVGSIEDKITMFNHSCLSVSVYRKVSNIKDPKINEPLIISQKSLKISNGHVKSMFQFTENILDSNKNLPENLNTLANRLNQTCIQGLESFSLAALLKGLFSASSNVILSGFKDAPLPDHDIFKVHHIEDDSETVFIVTASNRKNHDEMILLEKFLRENIDCDHKAVSILELEDQTNSEKSSCAFYTMKKSTELSSIKNYCIKSKQHVDIDEASEQTKLMLQRCQNDNSKTWNCSNFDKINDFTESLRHGFENIPSSSLDTSSGLCSNCQLNKTFLFDDMTYKVLAYANFRFNTTTNHLKMTNLGKSQSYHPANTYTIEQYDLAVNALDVYSINHTICGENTTAEGAYFTPDSDFVDYSIKHISQSKCQIMQVGSQKNSEKTTKVSCTKYDAKSNSDLKADIPNQNDLQSCYNTKKESMSCYHSISEPVQSFRFDLMRLPDTEVFHKVVVNSTTEYHLRFPEQNSKFFLFSKADKNVESFNTLFINFPISLIGNIEYTESDDTKAVKLDLGESSTMKIVLEAKKFSKIGLTLTTQDSFEIILFPKLNMVYHHLSEGKKTFQKLPATFKHFSSLFSNKYLTEVSIVDHEAATKFKTKPQPWVYVIDTEPLTENFINSSVERNVFRINGFCEGTEEDNECTMKSVHIQVDWKLVTSTQPQLVTFKNLCWLLREFGLELKLDLIRHADEIMIVLFKQDNEKFRDEFLGTVSIVGNPEEIVKKIFIELETMFLISKRGNELRMQPLKIQVPKAVRLILLQPEGAMRQVWYHFPLYYDVDGQLFKHDQSLFFLFTASAVQDEPSLSFVVICYGYFLHYHSFPNVVLEFQDEVVFLTKTLI